MKGFVQETGENFRQEAGKGNIVTDYQSILNPEQLEAVRAEGPVLVLAAAGTGKTHMLTTRVSYLIEHGADPAGILLLTFTNKAADEMKERAIKKAGEACRGITACTFHSFCAHMLRRFAEEASLPAHYTILTPGDAATAMDMLAAKRGFKKMQKFPNGRKVVSLLSESVNRNVPLDRVVEAQGGYTKQYRHEIAELVQDFGAYKEERALLDFDDLLVKFRDLLKKNEPVRQFLDERYDYIMVDEYQDTNYLQAEIVFLLRRNAKELCVVGDDCQSIYGFRGADVQNILDFPKKLKGTESVTLIRNYRSSQEILDLANAVMHKNLNGSGIYKQMLGLYESGEKPFLLRSFNQEDEAQDIAARIREAHKQGAPYASQCVLARMSMETGYLETLLKKGGIPYQKYGGVGFMERRDVQTILSLLRATVNPYDELAWYQSLQLFYGIGETYGQQLASLAKTEGTDLLIRHPLTSHLFAPDLAKFHTTMTNWRIQPFPAVLDDVMQFYADQQKVLLLRGLEQTKDPAVCEPLKHELLEQVDQKMKELKPLKTYAAKCQTAAQFLDDLTLGPAPDQAEENEDAVVISTIHSAKGLEFDTVYVMDCIDGLFPTVYKPWDFGNREDAEELRCFYVAVTRARRHLYLYAPQSAQKFGRTIRGTLSHYLTGLGGVMTIEDPSSLPDVFGVKKKSVAS